MHILAAVDRLLDAKRAAGRSLHTIKQLSRHGRLFAVWLAEAGHCGEIASISGEHLVAFLLAPVAQLRADGGCRQPGSANALRSSLRTLFGWLHAAGLIGSNPSELVERARVPDPAPRGLSDAEQAKLLAALSAATGVHAARDRALILLLLRAGLRLGAPLAAEIGDVDLAGGTLAVTTKGNLRAEIPLLPEVTEALRDCIGSRTSGLVFCGRRGRRLSARHAQRIVAKWFRKAGVREGLSAHSLRHSYAQRLMERTGDVMLVRDALLHRSVASTTRYLAKSNLDRAVRAMAG